MSDLKLAVGKKYWTRNGRIRTVVERDTGDTEYPWRHSGNAGDSDWCMDDGRDNSVAPHDTDLVRELTAEELLTEQTIDTFAKIVRNGGKVPDGMQFESRKPDGTWHADDHWSGLYYGAKVRLAPIAPPRFSVSTDPIGVLDSQKPGWIAKFAGGPDACSHIAGMLNRGERHPNKYAWSPIAPEMVPLELADVPPGSYFKRAGDSWLAPSDVCRTGVHFYGLDMPFEKLMEEGWQILRPGQTEWAKCEKPKP